MANKIPKEQKGSFYSRELEAARLRGEWDRDVNISGGARLPWSELIRKHMKHNPNEQSLPSVANAEQLIRSNLAAWYRQTGFSDSSYQEDSADTDGSGTTTFPVPLPQDQSGQGWSSQAVSEAIQQLSNLRGVAQNNMVKHTIAAIEAYALFAQGQDEATVELLHEVKFLEDVDLAGLKGGNFNQDYTLASIMMGYTVYGMANERLFVKRGDKGYIPFAYAGYACTIDLHESARGGKSANALRGLLADEIENWGEISLYRNALLSVRSGNKMMALNSLRAYQAHSGRWPSNFREIQRLVILSTYLRILNHSVEKGGYTPPPNNVSASKDDCRSAAYQTSVVAASASRTVIRDFEIEKTSRHAGVQESVLSPNFSNGLGGGAASSRTTSTRRPAPFRGILPPGPSLWSNEFLTVQKAASDTITRSSYFPKAGQVNIPALNLSDEIIRGWQLNGERGGNWADEVVDLLYLLSRVTFHSQRITRHLFNLLVASENYEEAKSALELYIQIVEKAREGDAAEAGGLVEESRRQEQGHEGPANGNGALTNESKKEAEKLHLDTDSDANFIDTLLHGIHIIAKYLHDGREADRLAKKVISFIETDPDKTISKNLMLFAKVKRVAGMARDAFNKDENDSSTRSTLQDEALALLKQSLTLDDQSSETYFALAYLQGEMLDVGNAIRSARKAVELEPANVDNWHLLTLLLSSQKDYRGALKIAELGLGEAEDDDEVESKNGANNGLVNGAVSKGGQRTVLLSMDYPPRSTERAESIVRLMVTHNALEEIIEGSQAAIEGQREIFEFFHRRIGANWQAQGPRHRHSSVTSPKMNGGNAEGPASIPPRIASKGLPQSTVLGGSQHQHNRFHSLTGLGQSGSSHHLLPIHSSTHSELKTQDYSNTRGGHVGIPITSQDEGEQEVGLTITNAQIRAKLHNTQQMHLLASLWLMAAATFRRSGKLNECRIAIQEAERVDPSEAEVWLQLALWFEQQPSRHDGDRQQPFDLAIQCLYKALACKGDHIGATIHLARLFLLNPTNPSIREVQEAIADVASPLPQTTDNIHATTLASDLVAHTQSRRITATGADPSAAKQDYNSKVKSSKDVEEAIKKEAELTREKKRLATVSLAEGLLVTITQSNGWNVPEAWLYLGKVMKETNRLEKQRNCLEYALQLEKAKCIRSLQTALPRSL